MGIIRDYHIAVPVAKIERLQQKLELADLPDELEGADRNYGSRLEDVRSLVEYWKTQFRWRDVEGRLNKLPNFATPISIDGFDTVNVHFLHRRSSVKSAIPLVFAHGWPGSFYEVTKLLPILDDVEKRGGPAFHVVAPSLPNFGFSSGIKKPGFGIKQYAETCHKLMLALGYKQYVSQGGDWGSTITRVMGQLYSDHLKASHLNLVASLPPGPTSPFAFISFLFRHALKLYTPAEKAGLERTMELQKSGMGYYALQTTRPQTVGYSLADSPVGLLGWMYEKLHDWTDDYDWTPEEVCTWVSLYWFSTAGPAASIRIYYESTRGEFPARAGGFVPNVKLGLAYFPEEIANLPRAWGYGLGPVVHVQENQRGGHFACWEQPEGIAGDLQIMFSRGGGAYGAVEGAPGYD
ncbi:alpha/beta-hydrolase [Corynespora cassiicola Philippines]|uniref:Alpha/beta-hydrolase n=1 Tax=Corynespora cassiicola Philippines TaxID=1448308 RepID=A0A2T2N8K0_CORCC|nr:alpha/beta-hydrolase [Corynespora cassiicola Philippines]